MPERDEPVRGSAELLGRLTTEAEQLVDLYRNLANQRPTSADFPIAGIAIGRAMGELDQRLTPDAFDRAERDLALAREVLTRIRRTLAN